MPKRKMQPNSSQFLWPALPREAMTKVPDREPIPAPVMSSPASPAPASSTCLAKAGSTWE